MIDYIDYLAMLLSTDWFRPYWCSIGIKIDASTRASIQEVCRGIVKQILSGADNYFFASFSEQRRKNTHEMLKSLLNKLDTEKGVCATFAEWAAVTHDETTAAWVYTRLTRDLFSNRISEREPKLDPAIETVMAGAEVQYELDPADFSKICIESESHWDQYITRLTPEQPTFLADILAAVLRARRFRLFWESVVSKLTPHQRQELVGWYRALAKSRGGREISPSYIG